MPISPVTTARFRHIFGHDRLAVIGVHLVPPSSLPSDRARWHSEMAFSLAEPLLRVQRIGSSLQPAGRHAGTWREVRRYARVHSAAPAHVAHSPGQPAEAPERLRVLGRLLEPPEVCTRWRAVSVPNACPIRRTTMGTRGSSRITQSGP
jgi:hypothetical protein